MGHPLNFSGPLTVRIVKMNVNKDTELLDYEEMEKLIEKERPKLSLWRAPPTTPAAGTGPG